VPEGMNALLVQYDPRNVALLLACAMFAAWGVAWWLGSRLHDRPGARAGTKLNDASLALLGLLLAFTFGMSLNKHDNRRDMVVTDANSIRDFYTSAALLKEPIRSRLLKVIRQYVELRLKIADAKNHQEELRTALPRFRIMQSEMREVVEQACEAQAPFSAFLLSGFNRLTNAQARRLAAIRDRLPLEIVVLLFVSAIVSTILVGREQGIVGRVEVVGMLGFILLVTLAIYVTLDLNQPQGGFVRVSQEPLRELLSSMAKR
jgi:hypothetical protein